MKEETQDQELARLDRANVIYLTALCTHYQDAVKSGRIREWANCLRAFANLAESMDMRASPQSIEELPRGPE